MARPGRRGRIASDVGRQSKSRFMKRTERHHLKQNEIEKYTRQLRDTVDTKRRELSWVLAVVIVAGVIGIGYFAYRERVQTRAHAMLADALAVQDARIGPPPAPGTKAAAPYFPTERERAEAALAKFKAAADAYPSTDAGIFARYQQAATSMLLDDTPAAVTAFQDVVGRAGNGLYGQMARLGVAEAQARAGKYDEAISTFKELALKKDGQLPIDGILMQLGRTYLDAGKRSDAQQTFNRVVEEFPDSPFNGDAKRELDSLKKAT
jgi:TolA-binding protein